MEPYTVSFAHTDSRIEAVYRLRYKVYCEERGFERPEDHPGSVERDMYDEASMHFAALQHKRVIGTARLVFNTSMGFPIEKYASLEQAGLGGLDRNCIGEVSRLAFSKEYRRHLNDAGALQVAGAEGGPRRGVRGDRQCCHLILRLYRSIYQECHQHNITHLLAIMADGLYRLLAMNGISFMPIGPPIECHGRRTPYICCISESLQRLEKSHPETHRFIMDMRAAPREQAFRREVGD